MAVFEDGFESNDFSAWTGTTGSPSVQSGTVIAGSYSMQCQNTDTAADEDSADLSITEANTVHIRGKIILNSVGSNYIRGLLYLGDHAGIIKAAIGVNSSRYLYLTYRDSAGYSFDTSATQLSLDTEYCIELECTVSNSNAGEVHVYLNEVEVADLAHTGLDNDYYFNYIDRVRVGAITSWATTNVFLDEIVVDTSFIGCGGGGMQILCLRTQLEY